MAIPSYINKKVVVEAVVDSINDSQNNAEIRTLYLEEYENPDKIKAKGDADKGYIPDVEYRYDDRIELYEVELDTEVELNKWILFSLCTRNKNGNFHIVTRKENLTRFKELLKSHHIKAKLIYF